MNNLCFNISTSKDFLNKLIHEIKDYKLELSSSRLAINAAMTAWHLIEWIYWEYDFHSTIKNSDFIKEIKLKYPKLQIMHDISNGAKHFQLNHHSPKVMETKLDHGSYSDDYSRDYDISRLQVVIDDETCDFINELENVRDFWIEYFRNVLNVNIVLHENVA